MPNAETPSTSEPRISSPKCSNKFSTLQDNVVVEQTLLEESKGSLLTPSQQECQLQQSREKKTQANEKDYQGLEQGIIMQNEKEQTQQVKKGDHQLQSADDPLPPTGVIAGCIIVDIALPSSSFSPAAGTLSPNKDSSGPQSSVRKKGKNYAIFSFK
ncbi:hypothetical protein QJS10_CPB20g00769 [Acorus calamus]|uniref:Uncharacterized protein n=1 Tax=Acorus calamus TaxID=4465 RepID=A0AAV9C7L0_ACOCL|nr:hypothetical protein QJS10_CPB20g00769 [Acorus calamus]